MDKYYLIEVDNDRTIEVDNDGTGSLIIRVELEKVLLNTNDGKSYKIF